MKHIRGWIGLSIFIMSLPLYAWEPIRNIIPIATGFGIGMMSSGFR